MSTDDSQKKKPHSDFTNEGTADGGDEIPSVTKLLNRKSLAGVLKKEPVPAPAEAPVSKPLVKKLQPSASPAVSPALQVWQPQTLQNSPDPLGKALYQLLRSGGATEALFLSITPAPQGGPVPVFKAKAAHAPASRLSLWTGMVWDPQLMPDVWNALIQVGWVELSPPEASTNIKSKRNVIRGAFGILPQEWVTLVRVGPPKKCRGIIAILSRESILAAIQAQLTLISAAVD